MLRLEPEDFTRAQAGPDAGEQAQGKERYGAGVVLLDEGHQGFGLRGVEGDCATAPTADAPRWELRQRIVGDPIALVRELEKG
ncbi:MAG TPA: hypothetical protein VGM64_03560 [Lacunisphaera sp.]